MSSVRSSDISAAVTAFLLGNPEFVAATLRATAALRDGEVVVGGGGSGVVGVEGVAVGGVGAEGGGGDAGVDGVDGAGVRVVADGVPTVVGLESKPKGVVGVVNGGDGTVDGRVGDNDSSDEYSDAVSVVGSETTGGVTCGVTLPTRSKVKFGGVADDYPGLNRGSGKELKAGGFYATIVRGANASALRNLLDSMSGFKLPKTASVDIAVCAFSAGTMPDSLIDGKARLRCLAMMGDATISCHVVADMMAVGKTVEDIQRYRSKFTTDGKFSNILHGKGFAQHISFAAGVNANSVKVCGTAFEALVGVLALYREPFAVRRFLVATGVLRQT